MFVSFFPRPKLFFISAILWTALAITLWYSFAGEMIGSSGPEPIGVSRFWEPRSLWFDFYFVLCVAVFTGFWAWFAPHPWAPWSILGSALILFATFNNFLGGVFMSLMDAYGLSLVSVQVWGALWGIWGLLLGPALVVLLKVVAEHTRPGQRLARLMQG